MHLDYVLATSLLLPFYAQIRTALSLPYNGSTPSNASLDGSTSHPSTTRSNVTLVSSTLGASSTTIHFRIPNTSDSLIFHSFGHPIPPSKVRDTLNDVYFDIASPVRSIPDSRVPRNRYQYYDRNGVTVTMAASNIHIMTWSQLDEIVTGLGCFMTGIDPTTRRDQRAHYQKLKFSVYMQGQDYLGSGTVEYQTPDEVAVEKRTTLLDDHIILQHLPYAEALSSNDSTNLSTTIPFPVPDTPVTLALTPLTDRIPTDRLITMLDNARSEIAFWVLQIPDARIPNNWFEYSATFTRMDGKASILIHAYVNHDMTWRYVDDVVAGLIQVASLGTDNYRPCLRFEVALESVGEIGLGTIWYTRGQRTISERAVPPVSALSENNEPNGSLPNPALHLPQTDPAHIPFPIIHSSITLTFTELGDSTIPISTVNEFFVAVFEDIQPSIANGPNRYIEHPLWFFKHRHPVDGSTISISIYTKQMRSLSWTQLQKLLKGLEVFMIAQRSTLVFDIDVGGSEPVAKGLVWYSPPRPHDSNAQAKRASINGASSQRLHATQNSSNESTPTPVSATSLVGATSYPVPSTPVVLEIALNGPLIPLLYVEACLTSALRAIAPAVNDRPHERLPRNIYSYQNDAHEVAIAYLGYSAVSWLTWQQLNWVLRGLLRFVAEREGNCRALASEVDIRGRGIPGSTRFGGLVLWYAGDEHGVTKAVA